MKLLSQNKIIPFRKPHPVQPRLALSKYADHGSLNFVRQHTGDAPEATAMRLSWLQIAARVVVIILAALVIFLVVAL